MSKQSEMLNPSAWMEQRENLNQDSHEQIEQLARWTVELDNQRQQLADRAAQLDRLQADLETQRLEIAETKQLLDSQSLGLETLRDELVRQQAETAVETERREAEFDRRERNLDQPEEDRQHLPDAVEQEAVDSEAQAESATESLEESSEPNDAPEQPSTEITFSRVSSAAPLSTASLLAKYGVNLEDDPEPAAAPPRASQSSSSRLNERLTSLQRESTASPTPPVEPTQDHQEEMDAYMARLFERQGVAKPATLSAPESRIAVPKAPAKQDLANAAPVPPVKPARPMTPRPPVGMTVDMAAMRELANMNARTAINTHVQKQLSNAAIRALAMLFIGLTAVTIFSWRHLAGDWWAFNGVCAAVLGAVIVGVRYVDALRRLRQKLIPSAETLAPESSEPKTDVPAN